MPRREVIVGGVGRGLGLADLSFYILNGQTTRAYYTAQRIIFNIL